MIYADDIRELAKRCEWNDEIYQRIKPIIAEFAGNGISRAMRKKIKKLSRERGYRRIEVDWRRN